MILAKTGFFSASRKIKAMSLAVEYCIFPDGKPCGLAKWVLVAPIVFARAFIMSTNLDCVPAVASAKTIAASLADLSKAAYNKSLTVYLPLDQFVSVSAQAENVSETKLNFKPRTINP